MNATRQPGEREAKMSRPDAALLQPIEGVTVPASRSSALAALLVAPLATILAGGVLTMWAGMEVGVPVNALIGCAVGVPIGLIVTAWAVRELCLPTRLVLGQEGLQIIRGTRRVLVQIPYGNVGQLAYGKQDTSRVIRIDLVDVEDPDTYLPGPRLEGRAFSLPLTAANLRLYASKPKVIFEALQLRLEEFRSSRAP
jgi:hypothetical protein